MNPQVLASNSSIFIAFLASFLIYTLFAGLIVLWIVDGKFNKEQVLHALLAVIIAWTFTQMLKSIFPVMRPYQLDERLPITLTVPRDGSFPSSHSAVAFALATSIWLHKRVVGVPFFIIAILVAVGRVVSNVHFVLDVLVGGFIGLTTSFILERMHVTKLLKK